MKVKVSNKTVLIIIYVILIITVFAIFAIIQNAIKVHSAHISYSIYIILFIAIALVSTLFTIAYKQISALETKIEAKTIETKVEETTQEIKEEQTTEKTEIEFTIDIKAILPKEKVKIEIFAEDLLRNMANPFNIIQALCYVNDSDENIFKCVGQFAYYSETKPADFRSGETLPGQAVKNKKIITISNIPDKYMTVVSGLGNSTPNYLTLVPLLSKEEVVGVIEFATFIPITEPMQKTLGQLAEKIADAIVKFLKK